MITNNSILIKKLEWGKYVSPISDNKQAPFNWYSFKHSFGSNLVSEIFSMFGLKKGDSVLDPFCGGGTTLIKAKLDGYNATGLDISPFSVFITNALTAKYNPDKLEGHLKKISHRINPSVKIPDVAILKKSFSEHTLKYIYSLRDSINSLSSPEKEFFLLALLSILDDTSKAKKSGGFLRITEQRRIPADVVKKMFIETSRGFINDLGNFNYNGTRTKAIFGDARNFPNKAKQIKYDAILTSPPYPNRHDYTRIYELELLVGFINDNETLKKLRYDTLRSHVEAKKKYNSNGYIIPPLLKRRMATLKKRALNNSQVIPMLYGYFEDMYLCLKEMSKVLKPSKYIGLVVSNVRFAGVMIPVDKILAKVGEQAGLKPRNIYALRYRGNSSQQVLKYKRDPIRESLIIWQRK